MFRSKRLDVPGRKNTSPFLILTLIILFTGLIIWTSLYKWYLDFQTQILVQDEQIVVIEEWELPLSIAQKLNLDEKYLKAYLKHNHPEYQLITWKFQIEAHSNIEQILESLQNPIIEWERDVTILEWWNIYDIDEYLTQEWLIEKWTYITYVNSSEKITALTEFFPFLDWLITLEWFLYPDTYRVVADNFKINNFVIKKLENFENKVYKPFLSELSNKEISDLVNLASIVEKEEKNSKEKSTVAGILKKRLDNGWMIGADITVCYPHELTGAECKMVVTKYINEKSEYNTRTKIWLPKTPIGNPSLETILATLNYQESEYWYYLHDTKSGQIYYWKTNAQHEQNKRLYLK